VRQIEKRGRDYEYSIRLDYLRNLNEHYENWIRQYQLGKVLIIDVNNLDYVANIEDFAFIVNKVDFELNNMFGV
jgi:deoxyadenosine/deoxycytidine kinase